MITILLFLNYLPFFTFNKKININEYAINDNKGILINPNQFIYSVEQGTPCTQGTTLSGINLNINKLW